MDNEYFTDFIRYYKDCSEDGNSYKELWRLDKEYDAIDLKLACQHGRKVESLDLTMGREIKKTKTLDTTGARRATREVYKIRADAIARKHGFEGKSYDEHMKEQEANKGQTQVLAPDDRELPPHSPSGGKKTDNPPLSKEEKRQAFLKQMQDAGNNLTKDKGRER